MKELSHSSRICLACSNPNPPDHSYCHQCGTALGDERRTDSLNEPASFPVNRRPPDESRLPPAGSFRSGVYRLLRALLINQGRSAYRPSPVGTAASMAEMEVSESFPDRGVSPPVESVPDPYPPTAEPMRDSGRPMEPLQAAAYWLTQALLVRLVLRKPDSLPVAIPAPSRFDEGDSSVAENASQGVRKEWELAHGLRELVAGSIRNVGNGLATLRGTLAADDGIAVPRYVEIGAVVALTLNQSRGETCICVG